MQVSHPYKKILTSSAVWALCVVDFISFWVSNMLIACLPLYAKGMSNKKPIICIMWYQIFQKLLKNDFRPDRKKYGWNWSPIVYPYRRYNFLISANRHIRGLLEKPFQYGSYSSNYTSIPKRKFNSNSNLVSYTAG